MQRTPNLPAELPSSPLPSTAEANESWISSRSARYARAIDDIQILARSREVPILLEGESGTGKTILARMIHRWSPRAQQPFYPVVLSTLDDTLASSALFGHTSGAYTGAVRSRTGGFGSAHHGTIFLDELGKCSSTVQQKLLHVIETGEFQPIGSDRTVEVDTRVIAATNVGLEQLVLAGTFLPDLYARLEGFLVRIPPLRERRADIPHLVAQILQRRAADCGYSTPPEVADGLMAAFLRASWPYNLRQLDSTLRRLMLNACGEERLTLKHCRGHYNYLLALAGKRRPPTSARVREAVRKFGSAAKAALALGVDRSTIHRHLRKDKNKTHRKKTGKDAGAPKGQRAK